MGGLMGGAPREEALLSSLRELALGGDAPLTPEALAAGTQTLSPPASAREIDVLLRMLLPSLEPRTRDGAWKLDADVLDELLFPRLAEIHQRARTRARALAGRDTGAEDEGVWLFERLRALADRVESRSGRLIREIDERLDGLEQAVVLANGSAAMAALTRQAGADAFLRNALYRTHWATRKLLEVRTAFGASMLLLLASPPQPLDLKILRKAHAELESLDDEMDRLASELRAI